MTLPRDLIGVDHRTLAPSADSDAFLVDRYIVARDAEAFETLLRRHGPAVYAVCRARLRIEADADDAYQVVWFVFARDVETIRRPDRLAAWLVRTAALTCLKLHRTESRRRTQRLSDDAIVRSGDDPSRREATTILAEELSALPERLRAAVVLCALEEHSNGEAATILGIPKGTVDSRLAAGKERLRRRLTQRGVTLATALTLDALFIGLAADARTAKLGPLSDSALRNAMIYASGSAPISAAGLLADGVTTTMLTTTRLLAAGLLAAGLMTTVGVGLYQAGAQDQVKPTAKVNEQPKAQKPKDTTDKLNAEIPPAAKGGAPTPDARSVRAIPLTNEKAVRSALELPFFFDADEISFEQLLEVLRVKYGIHARLDLPGYKRFTVHFAEGGEGGPTVNVQGHYQTKITLKNSKGLTVGEILKDAVAQLPYHNAVRVAGSRLLIGPAYVPPAIPNRVGNPDEPQSISPEHLKEQILGQPVSLSVEKLPLAAILDELKKQTGANIVLDVRAVADVQNLAITLTIDDVRLLSALELIADMANLKPVSMGNVYYITSRENAERLQQKVNEELFGKPAIPGPPPLQKG